MKTEDLKAQGLTDEQIKFVFAENGKDIKALQDENTTLKSEKTQLENDKKVLEKEKNEKEKAFNDLQKNTISKEDYDNKIKEIETNSKKEHEEYILNQLIEKALDNSKVLKTENSRKAIKGLIDMDKISMSKDQKELIGIKEQLDEIKKTDGYFFETKKAGYSPAEPKGDKGDEGGETSFAESLAKEANQKETSTEKSAFFN